MHIRECILDFLAEISDSMRLILTRNLALMKKVVDALFMVSLEKDPLNESGEQDYLRQLILMLFGHLGKKLPRKKFYPIVMENVKAFMSSQDPLRQESAFYIMSYVAEWVTEIMKRDLKTPIMTQYIALGLRSPALETRVSSILCLSFLTQYLQPDILEFHGDIYP